MPNTANASAKAGVVTTREHEGAPSRPTSSCRLRQNLVMGEITDLGHLRLIP